MSKPTGIYITEDIVGGDRVYQVALNMENQLTIVERGIRKTNLAKDNLQSYLAFLLQGIGELKMLGYTAESVKRLIEGKAGLDELVSISLNVLLMINRLYQLTQLMNSLQAASATMSFAARMRAFGRVSKFGAFRRGF